MSANEVIEVLHKVIELAAAGGYSYLPELVVECRNGGALALAIAPNDECTERARVSGDCVYVI